MFLNSYLFLSYLITTMIVLNLKTYEDSFEKSRYFSEVSAEISKETGVRIILCPPSIKLMDCAEKHSDVFAQYVNENEFGAFTGTLPANALKKIHVKGSLVNHSEKRIPLEQVKNTVSKLKENNLESVVCAESPKEVKKIEEFKPNFIAIEPKELIGSGISVSNAKPEIITDSLKVLEELKSEVSLLCGAGVSNKEDTKKSLELGAKGVLLASAFVKAKDPKEFLRELASVF